VKDYLKARESLLLKAREEADTAVFKLERALEMKKLERAQADAALGEVQHALAKAEEVTPDE
jgi:hypothetical protein